MLCGCPTSVPVGHSWDRRDAWDKWDSWDAWDGRDMTEQRHAPDAPDAVTRRRELGRERSERHRERIKLYGDGYRIVLRVLTLDVAELLARRFPPIRDALAAR